MTQQRSIVEKSTRLDSKKAEAAVTHSYTHKQQNLLLKANSAGNKFFENVNETLNCDDFCISKQRCHKRKLDDIEVSSVNKKLNSDVWNGFFYNTNK